MKRIKGNIYDYKSRSFVSGELIFDSSIVEIIPLEGVSFHHYIFPGLVDAHVHVESSMLTPYEFSKLVIPHGTVAVVTDPHEIANVMGKEGVDYMIRNGCMSPLKFYFGAPSCVPASNMDSSGSVLNASDVRDLLHRDDIWFLSEMMNYPGVINCDEQVLLKIKAAHDFGKPIDGHAPYLFGDRLKRYVSAGITTDHECTSIREAIEKIRFGMKIQIREGSAARNFNTLKDLISSHPESVMLCTDDSHPDDLIEKGHIDKIVRMGLDAGLSIFDLIQASVVNPVKHYGLPVGLLQKGDAADFIVVDDIDIFNIYQTFINGELVYDAVNGTQFSSSISPEIVNHFEINKIDESEISISMPDDFSKVKTIDVLDGELITSSGYWSPSIQVRKNLVSSIEDDVLKLVVLNRYDVNAKPAIGFVKGFGLKSGAIGCSIAHDCHHIIAVGVSDYEISHCINSIIASKGGIVVVDGNLDSHILPLPIAGIMSDKDGEFVAQQYKLLQSMAIKQGIVLKAPFMTLSFLSLLVIPELKLGDKGLFDVLSFQYTNLFEK